MLVNHNILSAAHLPDRARQVGGRRRHDLDGDGAPELVLSCEDATDERLGVFYLRRDPSQPWTAQCEPIDVAGQDGAKFDLVRVADVDGDGAADIVTSEEGLGEDVGLGVVWYRNPGT